MHAHATLSPVAELAGATSVLAGAVKELHDAGAAQHAAAAKLAGAMKDASSLFTLQGSDVSEPLALFSDTLSSIEDYHGLLLSQVRTLSH